MLSSYPSDIGPIPSGPSIRQKAEAEALSNPKKKPDTIFQISPHIRSVNGKLETIIPGADAAKGHQGIQDKKLKTPEILWKHADYISEHRYRVLETSLYQNQVKSCLSIDLTNIFTCSLTWWLENMTEDI